MKFWGGGMLGSVGEGSWERGWGTKPAVRQDAPVLLGTMESSTLLNSLSLFELGRDLRVSNLSRSQDCKQHDWDANPILPDSSAVLSCHGFPSIPYPTLALTFLRGSRKPTVSMPLNQNEPRPEPRASAQWPHSARRTQRVLWFQHRKYH